jgi:predicted lactoylglutathione lyase
MKEKSFKEIMAEEKANHQKKLKEFAAKGKEFKLEATGPGVVPQDIYDRHFRDPDDPDYKGGK